MPPPLREGDRLTREEFLRRRDATPELKRADWIDFVIEIQSSLDPKLVWNPLA